MEFSSENIKLESTHTNLDIEKLLDAFNTAQTREESEEAIEKIASLNLSKKELRDLSQMLPFNAIEDAREELKAKEILRKSKGVMSVGEFYQIASLRLGVRFLEKLGIHKEIQKIYDDARKKLLNSNFTAKELAETSSYEMVKVAFADRLKE